jgi:hypothetical protein
VKLAAAEAEAADAKLSAGASAAAAAATQRDLLALTLAVKQYLAEESPLKDLRAALKVAGAALHAAERPAATAGSSGANGAGSHPPPQIQ